jgi:hypothetical protein
MAFAEDLIPFFTDFGVSATVGGVACTGIFDNVYAATLGFTAGTQPMLIVMAAAVPSVAQGNAVTVAGGSYTVTALEPDGTGVLLLRLQEA